MNQPTLVQNFSLPGSIHHKAALDWSAENKISVCTSRCIYVFSSYCSPFETGFPLPIHKQAISAPSDSLDFDLIPKVETKHPKDLPDPLYQALLDRTMLTQRSQEFTGYRLAKWSPKGAGNNGGCLLATLTMDHRLVLFAEREGDWEKVCDLSETLYKIHKSSWSDYKESVNPKTNALQRLKKLYSESHMLSEVQKLKKRAHDLAAVDLIWTNMFGSASVGEGRDRWCYLIVSMKSGLVVWWKISSDDYKIVSLAHEWDPGFGLLTSICWQQTTPHSGFLAFGTLKGQVALSHVTVKPNDIEHSVPILLWHEEDNFRSDQIIILKASIKKYTVLAAKQCFTVTCEVLIADSGTIVKNVKHTRGPQEMPLTGLALVDSAMPQSNVMQISVAGEILNIKATIEQDGVQIQCNPIILDVDLENYILQGICMSLNGLLCCVVADTAVWFDHLGKREPIQFLMFTTKTYDNAFSELGRMLKPQFSFLPTSSNTLCKYIDYLEYVRLNLVSDSPMPEFFRTSLDLGKEYYEKLTDTELQFVRFLLKCYLSGLAATVPKEKDELEEKLAAIESVIMRNYISKVLSGNQDKIDLLSPAQGQSLLLMGDWLLIEYNTVISSLYEAFGYDCPTDKESVPARETCRICKLPVKLENMRFGQCEKKHKFARCCLSLILCDVVPYYQCLSCKSLALEDVWSNRFTCTFCSLPMTK